MAESDSTSEGVVSMASESGSHASLPAGEVLCQRCQMAVKFDWSVRKNSSIHHFLGLTPASPLAVSRFAAA